MKVLLASMEAALKNDAHTYAGGLGVLVGDKLRASQDMDKKLSVLTFSYPRGYVKIRIDDGKAFADPDPYNPSDFFKPHDEFTVETRFGDIPVKLLEGDGAFVIHTDLAPRLYVDTPEERFKKEVLLAKIAARLAVDYDVLHIEESHGALAALEAKDIRKVFTTHTPLPHGHEVWSKDLVERIYGPLGEINMTRLALKNSNFTNCVSKMHCDIMSRHLGGVDYVTNGVHRRWVSPHIRGILDGWKANPEELRGAKAAAKEDLISKVNSDGHVNGDFSPNAFTASIARRFTSYKRLDLVFDRFDELDLFAQETPVQLIFAGAAHPADTEGLRTIEKVLEYGKRAKNLRIAYLSDYDMDLARKMIAGSDAWLNVPIEGKEASGTSWMKAMLNGTVLITTVSGSVPEFATPHNAMLIPEGDRGSQADALLGFIKRAATSDTMGLSVNAIETAPGLLARRMMQEYFSKAYSSREL